jgi:hypothetical protein
MMKFGAEPKKIAILGGLGLIAAYVFYSNVLSTPERERPPARSVNPAAAAPAPSSPVSSEPASSLTGVRGRASSRRSVGIPRIQEFRPSLLPAKDEQPDLNTIDPMLRIDLLKRVQTVPFDGGGRNLFQFSAAPPPPPTAAPKIFPKTPQQIAMEQAQPGQPGQPGVGAPPGRPPAPPINLKFYGYAKPSREGALRAFLQDGDNIFVAGEGEIVNKRYRIVRIRTGSVEVEDTQSHNTQTLPLTPPPQPGMG